MLGTEPREFGQQQKRLGALRTVAGGRPAASARAGQAEMERDL
jgi:hypothetical protein